jgi:hypothetical protein
VEGCRRRFLRTRRPCSDRPTTGRTRGLLRSPRLGPAGRLREAAVPAETAGPLARYAKTIQSQRGDYNGRVLSIRADDLRTLAVIYDVPATALCDEFIAWGVLNADARRAVEHG